MNRGILTSVILAFAFAGCNSSTSPIAQPQQGEASSRLQMKVDTKSLLQGEPFLATVSVTSPVDSVGEVAFSIPTGIKFDSLPRRTLVLKANQKSDLIVSGRFVKPGYFNITTSVSSPEWPDGASTMVGFNVANSSISTSNSANLSKLEKEMQIGVGEFQSIEQRRSKLPEFGDMSGYNERVRADVENRSDIRNDFLLTGLEISDGKGGVLTNQKAVVNYVTGSGNGEPSTSEKRKLIPGSSQPSLRIQSDRQLSCPKVNASVQINVGATPQNYGNTVSYKTYSMNSVYVEVRDNNGIWPHKIMSTGYADGNGRFNYQLPNCDDDPAENNQPDIYYVVLTRDVYGKFVQDWLGRYNAVASGTYWNDTAISHTFDLAADSDDSSKGFFVLRGMQFASDYNAIAGGIGSAQIPMKIYWPGALNDLGALFGFSAQDSAYSPVGRIVMGRNKWNDTAVQIHEFGHEVKYYVGNLSGFTGCHESPNICNPMFAPSLDYTHGPTSNISVEQAANEGFAGAFAALVSSYYGISDAYQYYYSECYVPNSCTFTSGTLPSGPTYELRVGTFYIQYMKYLIGNGISIEPKNFGQFRESLRDTTTYNQGIYSLWNNFAFRSLPFNHKLSSNQIPSYCSGLTTNSNLNDLFKCIAEKTTLDKTKFTAITEPAECGLFTGMSISAGTSIASCNGATRLVYQTDGNLVLYRQRDGFPLWNARTTGTSLGKLVMQPDGNLVLYNASKSPVWYIGTTGNAGAILRVQDDGNLVVYRGRVPIWNSGTRI
jgi:hypothetical protein